MMSPPSSHVDEAQSWSLSGTREQALLCKTEEGSHTGSKRVPQQTKNAGQAMNTNAVKSCHRDRFTTYSWARKFAETQPGKPAGGTVGTRADTIHKTRAGALSSSSLLTGAHEARAHTISPISRKSPAQQLFGEVTSGPMATILRKDDIAGMSTASGGRRSLNEFTRVSEKVKWRPAGSSASRQRQFVSQPLAVTKERYLKKHGDLAWEVDVLRSYLELHENTNALEQNLQRILVKDCHPSLTGAKSKVSNALFSNKTQISSMKMVIESEIETVDARRDHSVSHGHTFVEEGDDGKRKLGKAANLEDITERLKTVTMAALVDQENPGSSQSYSKSQPCVQCRILMNRDAQSWQCCGGLKVENGSYCCICAADQLHSSMIETDKADRPFCRHCRSRWKRLQQLEAGLIGGIQANVDEFLDSVAATRALIGESLQHRLDLALVHCLLQSAEGIKALVATIQEGGLNFEYNLRLGSVLSCDGELDLRIVSRGPDSALQECLDRPIHGSRGSIPRALCLRAIAPGLAQLDGFLTALDVSGQVCLEHLPVGELASIRSLKSVTCHGCPRLLCPPPAIANQGGVAVMSFLTRLTSEGIPNTNLNLVMLGQRKTGKTSLKKALARSDIDLLDEAGLQFEIFDAPSCNQVATQMLMVTSAVYMLVWRVVDRMGSAGEETLANMVLSPIDALRLRIPNAAIILVATNAGNVQNARARVDEQIAFVQHQVQSKLQLIIDENLDDSVSSPSIWNDGESLYIDYLDSSDVKKLQMALVDTAKASPWWKQLLPQSYLKFRQEIEMEKNLCETPYLTWVQITEIGVRCELKDVDLDVAVNFLHQTTGYKYFGQVEGRSEVEPGILDCQVFVDQRWIADCFIGLMRPDRNSLIMFFKTQTASSQDRRKFLRLVHRLATRGILHKDLAPFLWPGAATTLSKEYWKIVRPMPAFETLNMCKTLEDYNDRILPLLIGFGIIYAVSDVEFQVPVLLASSHSQRLDARTYSRRDCLFEKTALLTEIPIGGFELLLAKMQRDFVHIDSNFKEAALYSSNGQKAQIFLVREGIEEAGKERMVWALKCFASSSMQLDRVEKHIADFLVHFPGVRLVKFYEKRSKPNVVKKPAEVCIISSSPGSVEYAEHIKKVIEQHATGEQALLTVDTAQAVDASKHRVVLVCIDEWIGSDPGTPSGLKWHICGTKKPQDGRELTHSELSRTLQSHTEFTRKEWKDFGIDNLCIGDFIKSGDHYFKPTSHKVLDQFHSAIEQNLPVIGLICPGYEISNFESWWPPSLPELKRHALFFDCRNMLSNGFRVFEEEFQRVGFKSINESEKDTEEKYMNLCSEEKERFETEAAKKRDRWLQSVQPLLIDRICSLLGSWRGSAPDFAPEQSDHMPCQQCIDTCSDNPYTFNRKECKSKLRQWQSTENQAIYEQRSDNAGTRHFATETCANGHTVMIERLLKSSLVYDAVTCPSCILRDQIPPFCFSREHCRRLLQEPSEPHRWWQYSQVCMYCPMCSEANEEESAIPIMDVLTPNVYVSYDEGADVIANKKLFQSTEPIVKFLVQQISQRSDLVCCFQVDKRRQREEENALSNEEMEAAERRVKLEGGSFKVHRGLLSSSVALILLSDAYCCQDSCVREFLFAVKQNKYIIPVLLPSKGPVNEGGPESGWTGPGGENTNWWHHASELSTCRDPDTKDAFSWSALSLFSPIDLRDMDVHDQDCWDMEKFSDAVFHISKLLQCFFHRDSLMPNKLQAKYASWRRTLLLERLKSFQAYTLAPIMQRVHDDKILKTEARALFNALDTDQDGTVTKEVLAYWGAVGGVPMEKDELGMLAAELERSKPNHPNMGNLPVCSKNGDAFSPFDAAVTSDLMAQCDTAKEGVISFDQLYVVLKEALDRRESCSVI